MTVYSLVAAGDMARAIITERIPRVVAVIVCLAPDDRDDVFFGGQIPVRVATAA